MPVTFFLDDPEIDRLRNLDPDREWRELQLGERAWILQTYLRLKQAGLPVELTSAPPACGLVVFHAKQRQQISRHHRRLDGAVLIGVRGDVRPPLIADFEIVQNGRFADDKSKYFLPSWPQPGLVPRDQTRGERIERLAYKGFLKNLHPDFNSQEWKNYLAERRVEWVVDAVDYADGRVDLQLDWPDFRCVDLVLAVRPPDHRLHTAKPATKLYNAWLAGVPALLGPEFAYRELRRSDLDYLEVASLADAKEALDRLLEEPGLYRAMVENGRQRADSFRVESLIEPWRRLLFEKLPGLAESRPPRPLRRRPAVMAARRLWRSLQLKPYR